jgi:C-terminal processing protease CtpA/Prc
VADFTHGSWTARNQADLYQWRVEACAAGTCATLQRAPLDTAFDPARDVRVAELGDGLYAQVPLAVWADGSKTLPATAAVPSRGDYAIADLPLRLAAVVSAWSSASMLYPYFDDVHVDWPAALPGAIAAAAGAGSPAELHAALWRVMAQLHDGHLKVLHPTAPIDGISPIAFRRFGDKLVVIGGMPEYMAGIAVGDELVSLDGVPAMQAYERGMAKVGGVIEGWRDYVAALRMSFGPIGTFRRIVVRTAAGSEVARTVPLVSDLLYVHNAQEQRAKPGSELAPGIFYVDFDELALADWKKLVPALQRAKSIIVDFRGYSGSVAFDAISHFTDHEVASPRWQVPVIGADKRYMELGWRIRPAAPRLAARIIALTDGRAVSAMETVLQMFQVNRLGVIVGEPSAGTNGNVGWLSVPGGFTIRFSGLRAAYADGSTVQGRGIVPERIVHPTLDGTRAGRDEILEAALALARAD